jgi:hypothetical protein
MTPTHSLIGFVICCAVILASVAYIAWTRRAPSPKAGRNVVTLNARAGQYVHRGQMVARNVSEEAVAVPELGAWQFSSGPVMRDINGESADDKAARIHRIVGRRDDGTPILEPMYRDMTATEREEQRRSFAFGNASMSNPNVTRAMVDAAADRMSWEDEETQPGGAA